MVSKSHFTYKDHVGILSKSCAQTAVERFCIASYFSLPDYGTIVHVQIFDRIFDGDDVFATVVINGVDHTGHRRRFPLAGAPGDQYESLPGMSHFFNGRGKLDGFE